jgi:tungstate transport system ATP-binding protein
MSTPLYELRKIQRFYGSRKALDVEHLKIKAQRVVGLVGPNGSGKSTLLRILAFLEFPDQGTFFYRGSSPLSREEEYRKEVTLLLQEPYLLKRSVKENIAYGLRLRGETSQVEDRVGEALQMVGLEPGNFMRRAWYQLSGGEAQRVALASRLVLRPRVLLLDEPTASVDLASAAKIKAALGEARKNWGTTLVVVSHDLQWLYEVADDVISLYNGRIASFGPENLFAGGWKAAPLGGAELFLEDGQRVMVSEFCGEDGVASLNPDNILLAEEEPSGLSVRNALQGHISQMLYENGSGRVLVRVVAGGHPLTARLTAEAVRDLALHPGKEIWALFKASSLKWLA